MLVAAEPLRERRWGQLMLALYREGRQADALRAFQRLRMTLRDELGIDPSAALRALELAILAQDPTLWHRNTTTENPAHQSAPSLPPVLPATGVVIKSTAANQPVLPAATEPVSTDQGTPARQSETIDRDLVTATVMFTDLVDSTAHSATVSVDESEGLRRAHFALLRELITGHAGSLVKNLGDGVMAVFLSPSAAMSCAVALQQTFEYDVCRQAGWAGLRIGVSAGEVTREGGDFFGDPVVEASRLCDRAQSGQILVAMVVKMMAGRGATSDLKPVGNLELKGFTTPVPTLELNWPPLPPAEAAVPLPRELNTELAVAFSGRATERHELMNAFDRCREGSRQICFVAGEPGIGKTTLTAVVARRHLSRGRPRSVREV